MLFASIASRCCAIAASVLLFGPASALGASITYTFSGTGTGTVGATTFTNAAYVITLSGDTSTISSFATTNQNLVIPNATMTIAGIGTATITNAVGIFDNRGSSTIGFQNEDTFFDQMDGVDPAFATYLLTTAIGPISGISPFALNQFVALGSTLGAITLSASGPFTFQATLGAAPPPPVATTIPVPMLSEFGVILLALLIASLAALRLRRPWR
jgi:exosortase sorting signal-containing protein